MMKVQIHLTDEDYIQFNIFYALHDKAFKKQMMFRRCFPFMLSLILIPSLIWLRSDIKYTITCSVIWLGYSTMQFFLRPRSVEKNIRKSLLMSKKEGRLLREPDADYHFADDAIHYTALTNSGFYHYSDVLKIHETTEHIFVMISAVSAIIIPLRDLGDQKDALLALLREKCPHIAQ